MLKGKEELAVNLFLHYNNEKVNPRIWFFSFVSKELISTSCSLWAYIPAALL